MWCKRLCRSTRLMAFIRVPTMPESSWVYISDVRDFHTVFFVQHHSSQIANHAPEPLPTASIVPKWCWTGRQVVLVLDFTVLSLLIVESPPWRAGSAVDTWPHTRSLIRICFPFYETFSFLNIYFMALIEFYVNRLNDSVCHDFVKCDLQTSRFKPQHLERKATTCSE